MLTVCVSIYEYMNISGIFLENWRKRRRKRKRRNKPVASFVLTKFTTNKPTRNFWGKISIFFFFFVNQTIEQAVPPPLLLHFPPFSTPSSTSSTPFLHLLYSLIFLTKLGDFYEHPEE